MDSQPKYKPQAESNFFVDHSTMRPPVEGTVPVDYLREDAAFYRGRTETGEFVDTIPMTVDMALLQRGQKEFEIYCTPCHGAVGNGNGIVIKKGFILPPNFHDQKVRDFADGYIFDVISNGVRNMPPYDHQIQVEDRWAIVSYFRALQRSQHASIDDVPADKREELLKAH